MIVVSSRIKPLSLQLANQIAAGEVVERPASVVKELLENAIDAQSHHIHIEIERGGSSLIRITDDGVGIDKDDLALAVTRHATSKLQTLSELEKIISLGFRGEALASVSAVSKLSIKTKQAKHEQAWMINTGTDSDFTNYKAEPEPVAHSEGTTIDVRDLFFNTPARRKFMRTVKTEFKHIDDIVKRIALSQFDVAFKLTHNKKLLRNLPKAVTEKAIIQRISKLFSPEFLSHANKVDFSSDHFSNIGTLRLWGWVSSPQWTRKQSDWQYFYVNGRYIKDKLVNHALRQAYQELLPEDAFSAYLLYLEIDPKQVDVNVHPTKHEVRFRESRLIHDFIFSALKQALYSESNVSVSNQNSSEMGLPESNNTHFLESEFAHQNSFDNSLAYKKSYQPDKGYQPKIHSSLNENRVAEHINGLKQLYNVESKVSDVEEPQSEQLDNNQSLTKNIELSFFGSSLGCLVPNFLMSQTLLKSGEHQICVVHILRAQQFLLTKLFQPGQCAPLLIPETINLMSSEIVLLFNHQERLHQWGLELSQLGDETLMIRSLPVLCGIPGCSINIKLLIKGILLNIKQGNCLEDSELENIIITSVESAILSDSEQTLLLKMLSDWVIQSGIQQAAIGKKSVWKILDESKLNDLF
ncbi:MAG: DNA mismatch repair endonuclease MutL [Gammaproteobacteria bacterium]|nr:DNA mismatch repair endonuclease MutL [Gammaproteobacteria bacterium]